MSNKTTFKRIALAVVAALGFGVLATGPSSATVIDLKVTPVNGTATTAKSDSTTAGTIQITYTSTDNANDTASVAAFILTDPTSTTTNDTSLVVQVVDTKTSTVETIVKSKAGTVSFGAANTIPVWSGDTVTVVRGSAAGTGQVAVKLAVFFDTHVTLGAGTYVVRTLTTPFVSGVAGTPVVADVSIVVSATATETAAASKVIDPTRTVAILKSGSSVSTDTNTTTLDDVISYPATADNSVAANIAVRTFNASQVAMAESVTVTISGAGLVCNVASCGNSITFTGATGVSEVTVKPNGVAGVGTIKVVTTTKTFADKLITFYAKDPATYTPSLDKPVIRAGITTSDVVSIVAKDVNGNLWGGAKLWLVSSDTSIAATSECAFSAADEAHICSVAGVKAGETKWTIGNASTLALSTVKSAEFAGPRVTASAAASVKIEFDKAAYAPGEKARIYVTPLDAAGLTLPGETATSVFATGGIVSNVAFSSGSDTTLGDVTVLTSATTSSTTGAKAGSKMYTVYMPFGKGTVTLTAKGGTGLPVAGQVAVTASAAVVDDSVDAAVDAAQEATDAAIAATDAAILAQEAADEAASAAIAAQETAQAAVDAVTALSAEVTKLIAQLATLQKLLNRVAKRVGVKR